MSGEEVAGLVIGILALLFALGYLAFFVYVYWRIFAKMGFSGALGFLMLLPLVSTIMFIYLAFSRWPLSNEAAQLEEEIARLRQETATLRHQMNQLPDVAGS